MNCEAIRKKQHYSKLIQN